MYAIGDLIIHGSSGVCRVEEITMLSVKGSPDGPRPYYILKPLYQSGTITTPADSDKVFSRPVISKDEALSLIDSIPGVEAASYNNSNLQQLEAHYKASFVSHSCEDLIYLTKSIYAKKREREAAKLKFGAVDRRYMDRAEDLLFGEFAVALGITRDEVPEFISLRLGGRTLAD